MLTFIFSVAVAAPALAATFSVSQIDYQFSPRDLTIHTGDTVVWTNHSASHTRHTATADNGSFNSGTMNFGASYSHTFSTPGTYAFYCKFHGAPGGIGMSGVITVVGQGSPPPSGTPLPNTGASPLTGPFAWLGIVLLLAGGAILLTLRLRRRA
jgi:plastocyanin